MKLSDDDKQALWDLAHEPGYAVLKAVLDDFVGNAALRLLNSTIRGPEDERKVFIEKVMYEGAKNLVFALNRTIQDLKKQEP